MNAPFPWLDAHWRQFESWCVAERVPHAILLAGAPGWGKADFALAMATRLLGLTPAVNDAVNEADRPVHPDLRWIEADLATTQQIRVEQIREFAAFVTSTSMSGTKVGVIAEAERMNLNAANALLKTLEEPAGRTHLILFSHRPAALPATLRSRCQVLAIRPSAADARAWLAATAGMSDALEGSLWLAGYSPLRALAMQREGSGDASLAALALLPRLAVGAVRITPVLAAAQAADPLLLLDGWVRALHDMQTGGTMPAAAGDWSDLRRVGGDDDPAAPPFTDALLQAKRHLLGTSNPNANLLFEDLLLRWSTLGQAA